MFSFVRNCQSSKVAVLYFISTSNEWVSVAPHPFQHLVLPVVRIWATLTGAKGYLIAVLICIFLMLYDVGQLFICLFANCVSLTRCLLRSLVHFLIELFIFLVLSLNVYCKFYIKQYQICLLQIFYCSL